MIRESLVIPTGLFYAHVEPNHGNHEINLITVQDIMLFLAPDLKLTFMAQTKLGENVTNTIGNLPPVGSEAIEFVLTGSDMKDISSKQFEGKNVVLNIFPSIDTGVCATSVRTFNKKVAGLADTVVVCVSKDLPFAMKRFCGAEGIQNVMLTSDFRNRGFSKNYGVELVDGGFAGLTARAIVVIDKDGKVKHTQLVEAIGQEPDYDSALNALS
jgi:thioredoxin-dependent peroxiredoxin